MRTNIALPIMPKTEAINIQKRTINENFNIKPMLKN